MGTFKEKFDIENFDIESIDTSEIDRLSDWLPKNGVVDLNLAERGLILTLHGQNYCQEQLLKIEKLIGLKEGKKNKAWAKAALEKADQAGHKAVKNKEWFAMADDDFIDASNEVVIAKAAKKWFENKSDYLSSWHFAFKSFLKRDYSLEKLGNFQTMSLDDESEKKDDFGGDNILWNE